MYATLPDRDVRQDARLHSDDAQLAAAGDHAAFERLYHEHATRVHTLARRLLGADGADDATQDVFMRVWDKLPMYQPDAPFGAWLQRVALHVILRRGEEARRPLRGESSMPVEHIAAANHSPDIGIDLGAALARLSAGLRHVVVLHDMEGYRHDEIAEQLGISVASSKMRLHRARIALRAYIR